MRPLAGISEPAGLVEPGSRFLLWLLAYEAPRLLQLLPLSFSHSSAVSLIKADRLRSRVSVCTSPWMFFCIWTKAMQNSEQSAWSLQTQKCTGVLEMTDGYWLESDFIFPFYFCFISYAVVQEAVALIFLLTCYIWQQESSEMRSRLCGLCIEGRTHAAVCWTAVFVYAAAKVPFTLN